MFGAPELCRIRWSTYECLLRPVDKHLFFEQTRNPGAIPADFIPNQETRLATAICQALSRSDRCLRWRT